MILASFLPIKNSCKKLIKLVGNPNYISLPLHHHLLPNLYQSVWTIQKIKQMATPTKGYDYGASNLTASPLSLLDLDLLKKTVLWSDADEKALKLAGEVLQDQTDEVLDLWYGFVGGNPHLLQYFSHNEVPNPDYLAAVRKRFGLWILDLCNRPYDQDWLNYQYEIALRHHTAKKNKTDGVEAAPIIHFRYMVAFIFPITYTIKGFLGKKGHSAEQVEEMYAAWFKAVTLTSLLWCYPYVHDEEY